MTDSALQCSLSFLDYVFPSAIDITAFKDRVDYEFADETYAHDFAEPNEVAMWVKIS